LPVRGDVPIKESDMEKKFFDVRMELKNISSDGTFSGYASTFGGDPDSYGDLIAPGAFKKSLEQNGYGGNGIKMLWQHDSDDVIGVWGLLREDNRGLYVEGRLVLGVQRGKEAYELLKIGAVNTMSIGFRINKFSEDREAETRTLEEIDLYEISLVTFPANTNATITSVKTNVQKVEATGGSFKELERVLRDAGFSKEAAKAMLSIARGSKKREASIDFSCLISELRKQQEALSVRGGTR
jgi:uncharacterized protein